MSNSSPLEDVLKELFNISVGKAASILSDIVNRKIGLDVPDIKILNTAADLNLLGELFKQELEGALMVSSISFKEKLSGKANLIFPADKMRSFIDLCLNETSTKHSELDFNDIDYDIIKEIGNIILNSIIGEIGNIIKVQLSYTLPEVKILNTVNLNDVITSKEYEYIVILSITFQINSTEIVGAVLINLTLKSLDEILLKTSIIESELE